MPVTAQDMSDRGWEYTDFVLVSGDAYVDHPSFAAALLGRLLEAEGYRVCVLAQPPWKGQEAKAAFLKFGQPRLAWLVSAGAMDSMVARYTANNKPRSEDAYSPGGQIGLRPDRALTAYCAVIREVSKGIPLIIGGIEASLRRLAHYDYWSNTLKRSILLDTKADLLVYGMGELPLREIAVRLAQAATQNNHVPPSNPTYLNNPALALRGIRGTCWRTGSEVDLPETGVRLPAFEEIKADKEAYCRHFMLQEQNTDPFNADILIERSDTRFIVQEKPAQPLETAEFDRVIELPYTRSAHPDYAAAGGIPALEEVQFSLTSCRGCFGACSFCAITFHQGRQIQSRSHASLEREARELTAHSAFKGYIHDVGGPTANFRQSSCAKQAVTGSCRDKQCLGDTPCPALRADHRDYLTLLRRLRAIPGIKKVFIRSGIRFDYLMLDQEHGTEFLKELCEHHVSGQLKVAPEHTSNAVLALMRKSTKEMYESFSEAFYRQNTLLGKKQYLIPYYIAGHPGATLADALDTALTLQKTGFVPDQVQDFYPTPGTLSTCMYYTGLDPATGQVLHVARGAHERALQRALLQFNKGENRALVVEALTLLKREDLVKLLLSRRENK